MGVTSTMKLPYPAPTDAPDGPGALYNLAQGVETALTRNVLSGEATLGPGFAWDTGQGLCSVVKYGLLRIVNFAIWNPSGFGVNAVLMTMNAGNRPEGTIWTGVVGVDNSSPVVAVAGMSNAGAVFFSGSTPDNGADGKVQSLRGTFSYYAFA